MEKLSSCNVEDTVRWVASQDGNFTIQNSYKMMIRDGEYQASPI